MPLSVIHSGTDAGLQIILTNTGEIIMRRLIFSLLLVMGAQSAFAATTYSNIAPFDLYSEAGELFTIDLSDATATNSSTGSVTYDPVYRIRNGYNPGMQGQLLFNSVGNYFGYLSSAGMANVTEGFNVLIDMKNGDTLWPDYTMNVLSFSSLIQLLDVPSFTTYAWGGSANIMITSYDRSSGAVVSREDLMSVDPVTSGYYAPTKGTVSPHVSGYPDVLSYVANPGASGWDRILVFTRSEAGKMGYNFFYIYIP